MDPGQSDRWQLRTPLPALWRPDGTLQLGLEPPAGLVVGRFPRAAAAVLDALLQPCSGEQLELLAGASAGRWLPRLIDLLQRAGLLHRAAPASADLAVVGSGRLPLLVAELLLAVVGDPVRVIRPGALSPPRSLQALQRRHPGRLRFGSQLGAEGALPGLTVVVARAPEADRSVIGQVADRPHLVVCGSDLGVAVGPFVLPGRTACLRCEDLHRAGRDPAWPQLLAQLSRPRRTAAPAPDLHWAAGTA
ncbi:MAG: hypothetical protein QM582_05250, partial [Micropruina sp.]|uniref:hypothetical protein n=1 Tax=Micropruina sp. TaxID=2737536 RepID=UPI0039E55194